MPAYKEKDKNTWTVKFKHRNWSGKIKWVTKRGFATKREALQYERDFLARKSGDLDMSFADFVQVYREERGARTKESTLSMKDNIIDTKLIPYFGKKCMGEITTKDIFHLSSSGQKCLASCFRTVPPLSLISRPPPEAESDSEKDEKNVKKRGKRREKARKWRAFLTTSGSHGQQKKTLYGANAVQGL